MNQEIRARKWTGLNNLVLHFRPKTVPERTLALTFTWGLGGMAVVSVIIQLITGVLLKFLYEPFPGSAYDAVVFLQNEVLFGRFIRNLHHWTGNILIVVAFLHMLRVFFTGAFLKPRRLNWIIGLGLLLLVLSANFTGYLLPWDQLAYWAITICTGMLEYIPGIGMGLQELVRGGSEVGPAAVRIFFTIHTAVLPGCLILLMAYHFWRIRKARGLVIPRSPEEPPDIPRLTVATMPNLILRELVTALVLIAFVMTVSLWIDAPLGPMANPGMSPNPTKAPWYFAGFQELLVHFHPLLAVFIIPLLASAGLLLVPFVHCSSDVSGVWFRSRKGRRLAVTAAAAALFITPLCIVADEYLLGPAARTLGVPGFLGNGWGAAVLIFGAIFGFYLILRRRPGASAGATEGPAAKDTTRATIDESIQAVWVLVLVSFTVLTLAGIWFRGRQMALIWPF